MKVCTVNDDIIKNIERMYSQCQTKQGVHFKHYGAKFEQIKHNIQKSTVDWCPSDFVCAFHQGKMVGFLRLFYPKDTAYIGALFSMESYFASAPNNALISKAVALACERRRKYLVYTKMHSSREAAEDELRDFKMTNGFHEMIVTRYYVALSRKGRLVLFLKLQHGIKEMLPQRLKNLIYSKKNNDMIKFRFAWVHVFNVLRQIAQ